MNETYSPNASEYFQGPPGPISAEIVIDGWVSMVSMWPPGSDPVPLADGSWLVSDATPSGWRLIIARITPTDDQVNEWERAEATGLVRIDRKTGDVTRVNPPYTSKSGDVV